MQNTTTWVEVNSGLLKHNLKEIRSLTKSVTLAPTVKANAYGHDIVIAAGAFVDSGADYLCVHSIEEAVLVRSVESTIPILIFGYVPVDQLEEVVQLKCDLTIYDSRRLPRLNELARKHQTKAGLHLKIETGIHRQGLSVEETLALVEKIKKTPHLEIRGISSHFANIEDTTDSTYANQQTQLFRSAIAAVEQTLGQAVPYRHIANSAATILYVDTHFTMVRPGISAYGMWPAEITRQTAIETNRHINLQPALTWKSIIAQVKRIPKGAYIGYGCTYKTTSEMQIAVVPVGYYDGYPREASNKSYVLVQGQRCAVIGRVCMNNLMIDVTKLEVSAEEEVVLLGRQVQEIITAEELAAASGKINYEITTGIRETIPRITI